MGNQGVGRPDIGKQTFILPFLNVLRMFTCNVNTFKKFSP